MAEYIDRDELIVAADKAVLDSTNEGRKDAFSIYLALRDCICEAKPADVAPVRHGQWAIRYDVKYGQRRLYCLACGSYSALIKKRTYCPNCGATMDLEAENG